MRLTLGISRFGGNIAADTTPPEITNFTAGPQDGVTGDVPAEFDLSEDATVFWVLVTNGDTAPSVAEVVAGQASGGGAPADKGSYSAVAGSGVTKDVALVDGLNGAYDLYKVPRDAAGNLPAAVDVVTNIAINTVSYTQNIVASPDPNTDFSRLNLANASIPSGEAQLTFSAWANWTDVSTWPRLIERNFIVRSINATDTLLLQFYDSAGATVIDSSATGLVPTNASGTLSHIQVNIDLSVPDYTVWIDGVDVTASFGGVVAGTGSHRDSLDLRVGSNPGIEMSDMLIAYGANISNATLYNGGTPPDLGTVAGGPEAAFTSAQFIFGGDMLAADLNSGDNIATGTVSKNGSSPFTDV